MHVRRIATPSRFASLIRMTLELSRSPMIPLEEEFSTPNRLYLELEKLRFGEKFSYQIVVDPSLEPSTIMVPPMLMQPLVENAIRHGILPGGSGGSLRLEFRRVDAGMLLCIVEDDGIGRVESMKRSRGSDQGAQAAYEFDPKSDCISCSRTAANR